MPEPNSRRLEWHAVVLFAMFLGLVGYMFLLPVAQHWLETSNRADMLSAAERPIIIQAIQMRMMQGLVGLWFLFLGGTIGSFLNVVVYRLPRGESIVSNPSSCPGCGTKILARDNLPVVGWLGLAGRCRACAMPISVRYPAVEAFTALIFFLFFVVQLTTGSANLPGIVAPYYTGIAGIVFDPQWPHIRLYLYHCMIASIVLTWTLADFDSQRIGAQAHWVVASLLVFPMVIWSDLMVVPLMSANVFTGLPTWLQACLTCLAGGWIGAVLGWGAQRWLRDSLLAPSILAWIGMGLGWQATITVLVIGLTLRCLTWWPLKLLGGAWLPLSSCMLLGLLIHHLAWRWLAEQIQCFC